MIYVVPLAGAATPAMIFLSRRLERVFDAAVEILSLPINMAVALDSGRRQYNSTALIAEVLGSLRCDRVKAIGITDVDLFIPVFTFVFGEAQLSGTVAIVSTYRLRNEFYGLPEDDTVLLERLEKECIHEIGHTFGLVHCVDYGCVMHASASVEEIDIKGSTFCFSCADRVNRA
jgi:archaemetzincin